MFLHPGLTLIRRSERRVMQNLIDFVWLSFAGPGSGWPEALPDGGVLAVPGTLACPKAVTHVGATRNAGLSIISISSHENHTAAGEDFPAAYCRVIQNRLLEFDVASEFDRARTVRQVASSEGEVLHTGIGVAKVRMIEAVQELALECKTDIFTDWDALRDCHINVEKVRPAEYQQRLADRSAAGRGACRIPAEYCHRYMAGPARENDSRCS